MAALSPTPPQGTTTTNLVFPCLGGSPMSQCTITAWINAFKKHVFSPKGIRRCRLQRRVGRRRTLFYFLGTWMSFQELEKQYQKSSLKLPVPCAVTLLVQSSQFEYGCSFTLQFPPYPVSTIKQANKNAVTCLCSLFPIFVIVGDAASDSHKEKTHKCKTQTNRLNTTVNTAMFVVTLFRCIGYKRQMHHWDFDLHSSGRNTADM